MQAAGIRARGERLRYSTCLDTCRLAVAARDLTLPVRREWQPEDELGTATGYETGQNDGPSAREHRVGLRLLHELDGPQPPPRAALNTQINHPNCPRTR